MDTFLSFCKVRKVSICSGFIIISTVGVAEVNLCFYCTALTRIHSIHTVRAEGSLVRSDSGLELVQALLPAGRLQAADRRLI